MITASWKSEVASYTQVRRVLRYYYMFICGAIVNPGVYQVKSGTRLIGFDDRQED